ncbi:MAG: MFS transporter, partial [Zoogloea sp.]|nr:MFS transporter [Zoogloea sp.]
LLGFLLMGCFVSLYNYLGYRLMEAPFSLSTGQIGAIFLLYLEGMVGSSSAGRLSEKFGRRNVPWLMIGMMLAGLLLTLSRLLPLVVCGVGLFTFGFFGAHATASSGVGRRAQHARALAAALYLSAYYLGSALVGGLSGLLWHVDGWSGVAAGLGMALLLCLGVSLRLRRLI